MVGRVSVKVIAICMVSAVIIVGVVPDSKGSALVSWWYRTGIFKAIPKWFLYFFEAEEILGLTIAPWLSSSLGLLNLTKSSLAVLINVYFSSGVVLCSPYIFSNTSLRDLKNNHPGSQSFLPWLPG